MKPGACGWPTMGPRSSSLWKSLGSILSTMKVTLCWSLIVSHTHGGVHVLRGDRSGFRTDRDDVPEGGARDLGLRTLLPHDRGFHPSRARGAVEGGRARQAA